MSEPPQLHQNPFGEPPLKREARCSLFALSRAAVRCRCRSPQPLLLPQSAAAASPLPGHCRANTVFPRRVYFYVCAHGLWNTGRPRTASPRDTHYRSLPRPPALRGPSPGHVQATYRPRTGHMRATCVRHVCCQEANQPRSQMTRQLGFDSCGVTNTLDTESYSSGCGKRGLQGE